MSDLLKAAEDARKLLRGFKALDDVAAALEQVGSLQQARKESEDALQSLGEQIAAGLSELAKIREKVKKADADAKEKFEAEAVVHAGINAQSIAAARTEADAIVSEAIAARDAINAEIEALKAEARAVVASRDDAKVELVDLESRIESAKAQIAKLLEA